MARKDYYILVIIFVAFLTFNLFWLTIYHSKYRNESIELSLSNMVLLKNLIQMPSISERDGGDAQPVFPHRGPSLTQVATNYIQQELIFVVGWMSSGTTLLRVILDTHPEISCGDETGITNGFFDYMSRWNPSESVEMYHYYSKIRNSVIEKAAALFTYYIMENNLKSDNQTVLNRVKYLCNKEPANTLSMDYIHRLFPRARFVYVLRDGRDMAYSYMKRMEDEKTFKNFYKYILMWNRVNQKGTADCRTIGPQQCLLFKYETLVNEPEPIIRSIAKFLRVDFVEDMLHYYEFLDNNDNKRGGKKSLMISQDFVDLGVQRRPINNGSVGSWRNKIIGYDEELIARNITMLKELNYI